MLGVIRTLRTCLAKLRPSEHGNVIMICAFALIPITFATGMTIDYARAARIQTRINAVTDAAALSGVTPGMLSQTRAQSAAMAIKMWYGQMGVTQCQGGTVNLVIYNPCSQSSSDNGSVWTGTDGTITVTVTDTNTVGLSRVIAMSYNARSVNIFGSVLRSPSIAISGTTSTNAKIAPNIDFYVMLDTSGSMAFPSTSAGITLLRSKANGCAFACHSTNDATARDANNKVTDYYGVATSYSIPLRVDEAKTAIKNMMSLAVTTGKNNNATYQAALTSFAASDTRANNSFQTLQGLTNDLPSVGTAAGKAATSLYYSNGNPTKTFNNNDQDTASSDAFNKINLIMPNPGNGTKVQGDKPQEILFIVTDGMRDEFRPNGRPEVAFDSTWCTTIKARGIRIAILYTEYLQSSMDGDSWSQTNVVPYLYKIEPALTDCATPGLIYKVTTDDDISSALNRLFLAAVSNAHITQ
jgi:Flp pilus assembly protein TadG